MRTFTLPKTKRATPAICVKSPESESKRPKRSILWELNDQSIYWSKIWRYGLGPWSFEPNVEYATSSFSRVVIIRTMRRCLGWPVYDFSGDAWSLRKCIPISTNCWPNVWQKKPCNMLGRGIGSRGGRIYGCQKLIRWRNFWTVWRSHVHNVPQVVLLNVCSNVSVRQTKKDEEIGLCTLVNHLERLAVMMVIHMELWTLIKNQLWSPHPIDVSSEYWKQLASSNDLIDPYHDAHWFFRARPCHWVNFEIAVMLGRPRRRIGIELHICEVCWWTITEDLLFKGFWYFEDAPQPCNTVAWSYVTG